ncbi:DUF4252 domain-containing protein [Dokdonia sp. Hel_I_53]|uniref:DUF4252 domain-containing protein n=1 Tax=Dokdonia sp. Hel_I_53 TaxID=1566287 RepID=UPI001199422B|nr:DUF4252 domain-containing protein [Dokdonia sp. Hel_I_53]TVZ51737.1 uncharacterized protein DUF4252 [Dokdonia sp. Hel_I_53]
MNVLIKYTLAGIIAIITLSSCSNEQSLQEYYVANQENNDFILIDVPTSLIGDHMDRLDQEQQKVFKTVRKINLMAYQTKGGDTVKMQAERDKVKNILSTDDYEELMKANSDMGSMRLYFKGDEDAIDEVIFFGADENKGFLLARLLGDDMNIGDMMKLAQSLDKADVDVSQFSSMMEVFDNK